MKRLFYPTIALLNRMGYTKKFTLLWLVSLVAISVVVYSLFASLDRVIQPSQRELQGLALIEPVSRTVQSIQLHRGLSTALLSGNETMRDRRAAREREAAEAFKAMEGVLPTGLASSEDFRSIKANWERLRKEGLQWTVTENFAAHTRLVGQLQLFELSIADDYALTLDTELTTFYLIDTTINRLPHALEHLGQLRAYGTGILARKQITESQKAKINSLMGESGSTLNELKINLDKTGRYNPAVRESLLAAYGGIADSARRISGLVESDILTGHFTTPPDGFMDMATTEIDNGYTQMYQVLLPTTKMLIEARIAQAKETLLITVSSALLLFLLVVYISVSIYYAIIGSIKSLVHSANIFAGGDLSQRINLGTRDEISQIGESFNKMADGFTALLEARKLAQLELQHNQDLLNEAQRMGHLGSWELDLLRGELRWSDEVYRIFELDPARFSPSYENFLSVIHPGDRDRVNQAYTQSLENYQPYDIVHRLQFADGRTKWVHEHCISEFDASGEPLRSVGAVQDITEQYLAAEQLRIAAATFEAQEAILITDPDANVLRVNQAFEGLSGYSAEELLGKNPRVLQSGRHDKAFYQAMWSELLDTGKWSGEIWDRRKDGEIYPKFMTITAVYDDHHQLTHYVAMSSDISQRKQSEQEIHQLAFYDPLTKLPNRRLLLDRLRQAMAISTRSSRHGAVLFLDLDHFKTINDTQGHAMGDLLLIEVARRLQGCVREGDGVARLGGGGFLVLLEDMSAPPDEIGRA